jgi:hypothetical protein
MAEENNQSTGTPGETVAPQAPADAPPSPAASPLQRDVNRPEEWKIKYSVIRVFGLSWVTSGLYWFYWFYQNRKLISRDLGTDDNAGLQTVGLIVPILNLFVLYWIYRDINRLRKNQNLEGFSAGLYVFLPLGLVFGGLGLLIIGIIAAAAGAAADNTALAFTGAAVFMIPAILALITGGILYYVFAGLAISKLNNYWDVRSGNQASDAKFSQGEIIVIVIGVALWVLNGITGAISDSSGTDTVKTNNSIDFSY